MVIEGAIVLSAIAGLTYKQNKPFFKNINYKREIKKKWNLLIGGSINKVENKIEQPYELLNIFIKHYGFDAIISIPIGMNYTKLKDLIPMIETTFGSEIIIEMCEDNKSAYMMAYDKSLPISIKSELKFKWYKSFVKRELRNSFQQTYKIIKIESIYNLNEIDKKDKEKGLIGYKLFIKIPLEMSFEKLEDCNEILNNTFGYKTYIKWNDESKLATCSVIINELSDNEKFKPHKLGIYEFYVGMNYEYEPIILDFQHSPHLIYTGKSQTGKTVALLTGLTNILYWNNEKDVELYLSMISSKQDIRIFSKTKQCKYYANNIDKSLRLFNYLTKELTRRNNLFEKSNKFVASMYQYNDINKNNKLPLILLTIDEMTLYMPMDGDSKEIKKSKNKCLGLLWKLLIEGASAGVNVLFCLQRPDRDSFKPQLKAQIGNKIGFFQPNTASALTVFDDHSCAHIKQKREAIVDYSKGRELMKTLYLDFEMIEEILKDKFVDNKVFLNLNQDGNIIKKCTVNENILNDKIIDINNKTNHKDKQYARNKNYIEKKNAAFKRS